MKLKKLNKKPQENVDSKVINKAADAKNKYNQGTINEQTKKAIYIN